MNDELLARALLHSDRKPLVVVLCPRSNHKDQLGKVYEMPAGKAPVLCVPEFKIRPEDLFEGRPALAGPAVFRTWAYPLDGTKNVISRCKHGTWAINLARLRDDVARANLIRIPASPLS